MRYQLPSCFIFRCSFSESCKINIVGQSKNKKKSDIFCILLSITHDLLDSKNGPSALNGLYSYDNFSMNDHQQELIFPNYCVMTVAAFLWVNSELFNFSAHLMFVWIRTYVRKRWSTFLSLRNLFTSMRMIYKTLNNFHEFSSSYFWITVLIYYRFKLWNDKLSKIWIINFVIL